MALVSLRQLLDDAAEHGYGVPAFNVNNMEQIQAIMHAADEADAPVILQASAGARKYAGEPFLRHLAQAAVETWPHIPIVMHQDHGASPAVCQASIRSGFTSVMMDGSLQEDMKTPATYEYNVATTCKVVELAHSTGVSVEGELGCLGSLESGMAGEEDGGGAEGMLSHEQLLTDPAQAADFVTKTDVDALAIAIGTSHGAPPLLGEFKLGNVLVPDAVCCNFVSTLDHLVNRSREGLHRVRRDAPSSADLVPVEEIQEGIRFGVRKVNIDTDIRLAMTGAIRRTLGEDRREFDPRKLLKDATAAAKSICAARFEAFGCHGRASKLRPVPLEKMADRYRTRER